MQTLVRERTGLQLNVHPDGTDLIDQIAQMCSGYTHQADLTDTDFAKITAEALMNYKMMLEMQRDNCQIIVRDPQSREYSFPVEAVDLH